MIVNFKDVVVLDVYVGTSKTGNQFGRLEFLSDYQFYSIFVGGDDLKALSKLRKQSTVEVLPFDLRPDRSGGVRLHPAW